ncbi:MAG: T9SS type A sorting domain-containing protein [Tannerella sp.]|jgi:hypothetical protein|nr:T9SS type A sorting domain-containing protein [Tannerella sp.]
MKKRLSLKSLCMWCCLATSSFFTNLPAQEITTVWVTFSGTYDAKTFNRTTLSPIQTNCPGFSSDDYNTAVSEITGGLASRIFKIGDTFNIPEGYAATEITIYGWPRNEGSTYIKQLVIDPKTTDWTETTSPYVFADCGAAVNATNRTKDNCSVHKIAGISEENPVTGSFATPVSRETHAFYKIVLKKTGLTPEPIPAFPGAEGGGMHATGGRGGTVYYVNTLEDNNTGNTSTREGSLRWAINQTGKRTILFKVSGNIVLNSRLSIRNGDVTIAGQTAPGDGICLAGYDVTVDASNVVIRYMRFRMGDLNNVQSDAIWGRYQNRVILDHCSMSWSVDECASFYENEDFTMQWCILSESLRISKHDKGAHGYGGIWGGKNASFHHNLLAHHDSRNPRFAAYTDNRAEGLVDFRNNVIYNWGGNSGYGGEGGRYNMVNNYYQPGPASSNKERIVAPDPDQTIDPQTGQPTGIHGVFYVAGNVMMNTDGTVNTAITGDNWRGVHPNSKIPNGIVAVKSDMEYEYAPVTTHTAQKAYQSVLDHVGASFSRDVIDKRVINEVRNRLTPVRASGNGGTRAGLIDSQADVGGWCELESLPAPPDTDRDGMPDEWETANGLNRNDPSDGIEKSLSGGTYTNLEVYLNGLVEHITVAQNAEGSTGNLHSKTESTVSAYTSGNTLFLNNLRDCRVDVYTISGILVTQKKGLEGKTAIDLPPGIFIVRIISKDHSESFKIII